MDYLANFDKGEMDERADEVCMWKIKFSFEFLDVNSNGDR